jgi:hypothetical protein
LPITERQKQPKDEKFGRNENEVGGSDPTHGPVGGIHWHINVGNKIAYIATDEARQKIPTMPSTLPWQATEDHRRAKKISNYLIARGTKDKIKAKRLLHAKNEADHNPLLNRRLALTLLNCPQESNAPPPVT